MADIPNRSDTIPERLELGSSLQFDCHKGMACYNACCRHADVTLTPYDVLRLKDRLGLSATEFLRGYTVPFKMDQDGLPGIKLRTDESGACRLVVEAGCSAYDDRPTACRYYPLGHMALKRSEVDEDEASYFLVNEEYCEGLREARTETIQEYLTRQQTAPYDALNREWLQILLKKRSAGPTVGRLSESSLQLFFMCSFDVDRLRRFVLSENFRETYRLEHATLATLEAEDLSLLRFGFRLMRQVFFGERSIPEQEGAWEQRVVERKAVWDARRESEIARRQREEDEKYRGDL